MIWQLGQRRLDFAHRTHIMGILNTTPDSFFDGGRYSDIDRAVTRCLQMEEEGADIIDVGGESSRPSLYGEVLSVELEEECKRVVPVVEGVRRRSAIPISIDTTKAEVARRALGAGADIINDISALTGDPAMAEVVAASQAPVVLMHRRGTAATMQRDTHYNDLVGEVKTYLAQRIAAATAAGIGIERLAIDPGLGFGKSPQGNFTLLRHLGTFAELSVPILVGASRKSFVWKTLGEPLEKSLEGSLAVAVFCVLAGVQILRVHDVAATVRAVRIAEVLGQTEKKGGS